MFKTLHAEDISSFEQILGSENVITDVDELNPFVKDFTNKYIGIGSIVLTPTTTEQISEVLKYCN